MNNELGGFDNFLDQMEDIQVDQMETEYRPLANGKYPATVVEIKPSEIQTKQGPRKVLQVRYELDQSALPEEHQSDRANVKFDTVWLDFDSKGRLEAGTNANISLGRFRHATGTNSPMTLKQIIQGAFQRRVMVDLVLEASRKDPSQMVNTVKGVHPVEG